MTRLNAIDLLDDKRRHLKTIIDANCPYEALQILAIDIEFMGRLIDRINPAVSAPWSVNRKEASFENVCTHMDSMKKYNAKILQDQLRNGLVHQGVPKNSLWLTDVATQKLDSDSYTIINIHTIFTDFSSACDELIALLQTYNKNYPNALDSDPKFPHLTIRNINEIR